MKYLKYILGSIGLAWPFLFIYVIKTDSIFSIFVEGLPITIALFLTGDDMNMLVGTSLAATLDALILYFIGDQIYRAEKNNIAVIKVFFGILLFIGIQLFGFIGIFALGALG